MSQNQSRAERSESTQYRKTGRSLSSNQQRGFGGGASAKGGAPSNRSFKKYNNNAQGGQPRPKSPNVSSDSGNPSAPHAVQNAPHQQQPTQRVSDVQVASSPSTVNMTDASTPKISAAVTRAVSSTVAPKSNISVANTESRAPTTPAKAPGDPSKSFPLQFGSISPGFVNGMQIPPRTSSAPPNLDEQKKAQARHESLKAVPAMPIPSAPKPQSRKKEGGILDQPNAGEAQAVPKPNKRDPQLSGPPPVTQTQKPALHPMPGMPMQLPFHSPQVPLQFGGPNPQIHSQAIPGTSLPMSMQMPLPMGSPPMFVSNLQAHHHMQSQGIIHQGQNLNFAPQMGHQLPPQLGNMGINMAPQFPPPQQQQQQPGAKFSPARKPVKITHPDTHEELRLEGSPAPRSQHPNVPPPQQSQPIPSFPPNHPMNFYPNSYNAASLFYPAGSSGPMNTTQVPPASQPPRFYNQVTVKPPVASHGEKEQLPAASSLSVGKGESKPQAKPGLGKSSTSSASSGPVNAESDERDTSAPVSVDEVRNGAVLPDSIKEKHTKPGTKGQQDQVSRQSTPLPDLPSQLPQAESNLKSAEGKTNDTSKSLGMKVVQSGQSEPEPKAISSESSEPDKRSLEASLSSLSLESQEITAKTEESSDQGITHSKLAEEKPEVSSSCSNDVKMADNLVVPTHTEVEGTTDNSVSANGDKTSAVLAPLSVPSPAEAALGPENQGIENNSGGIVSRSPSSLKDKVPSDGNVAKGAVPRGKKKKKELYKKAEAAGTSSDLYNAYKGPEEKKETVTSSDGTEDTSSINTQTSADLSPENAVSSAEPAQSKTEPDDWEDATETPKLETSKNEINVGDGNGLMTKKYSRDFLLKFVEQCSDLPEGFEISSDVADALMVSSVNASRESYPSPGRNNERPVGGGSRPHSRGSGMGDDDKWNKFPGPLTPGGRGGDMWAEVGHAGNIGGFRPGQGGNHGVLRNPRAQTPVNQYVGGILSGPMQSHGPQGGPPRNNSDSDRWQRGSGFQKGLMPYPQAPLMHKAEKKYEVGKVTDEEQAKQRQLKGILNKLTPQNFEKLFQQVKEVNIDNVITLSGVISQIFDKALMEPTFCEMYANFCFHLAADLPDLSVENERITFKRLLLNKCQEEFERGEREEEEANKAEEEGEAKQTPEEREEKRIRVRRRMLGNIRLIGELYKKRMLTERIMHECINKLLGQNQNPDEENIEALCKLMSTIGEMIDHPKAKGHMDAYFDIMFQLSNNMKLSSRVRFMLKDVIDLRKNRWQQRRKVEGPKKIEEVHRDAAQERQAQTSRLSRAPSMGSSVRRGPPMEFAPRSHILSSPGGPHMGGGYRPVTPQQRGFGSQDARIEERHSFEHRSVPLPQRPLGDDSITLGPQGGLVRGMGYRGHPSPPSIPMAEMQSPGDARRTGPGLNGFGSMQERTAYGQREDLMPRYMPDRFDAPSNYGGQSHPHERGIAYGNREVRITDHGFDRSVPSSPPARGGPPTSIHSENVLSEDRLRDKSLAAIKEFYSARDENEVALCIKDLNSPGFYPSMISIWVTDSFERKDVERDLLTNLLISLTKSKGGIISEDHLIKGSESVLAVLEDAVNDAPRAAEFLGRILARITLENIVSLSEIGKLIYEGGEEQGSLVETGLASEVLGSILGIIESEKGEIVLKEILSRSNLRLENFRPPGSNKSLRIDKFIV